MAVKGSSPGDEIVQRWPHATLVGALGNQVLGLYGIDRPALVHHKFNSRVYYCLICESAVVIDALPPGDNWGVAVV
jgi:hypothetical protein